MADCVYCGNYYLKMGNVEYCSLQCRFWDKVLIVGGDDCWLWNSWIGKDGYGKFRLEGNEVRAHRMAYELSRGKIPEGMIICHQCDVRSCTNPNHLFLGTKSDNNADMVAKGRHVTKANEQWMKSLMARKVHSKGEDNGMAKLTAIQAREIKHSLEKAAILSKQYKVGITTIRDIKKGKSWKHI